MPFQVPPLPYPPDALEPHVDEQTMLIHHGKHHRAYVDKLNAAVAGTRLAELTVEEIVADLDRSIEGAHQAVRDNGGGHYNHGLFWESMSPTGGGEPGGALGEAIARAFGSFDGFKTQFESAGVGRFGSGWVWLVCDGGSLAVTSTPKQDNPLSDGRTPLLGNDVWEHAYYLRYQNRRPEYLEAWWNVVDWTKVAERYDRATRAEN